MAVPVVYDSLRRPASARGQLREVWERRALVRLLIQRHIALRYQRSALGIWWTLLNPMLEMAVLWVVFSQVFRFSSEHAPYVVYLLAGIVMAKLFTATILAAGEALIDNAPIVARVAVPGEVFAVAAAGDLYASFLLSLGPLLLIMVLTGTPLVWTLALAPVVGLLTCATALGLGLAIAPLVVHFPDTRFLLRVILTLVTYLAPVFYPYEIVPDEYRFIAQANPLLHFLNVFRAVTYEGTLGALPDVLVVVGAPVVALTIGLAIYRRTRNSLITTL